MSISPPFPEKQRITDTHSDNRRCLFEPLRLFKLLECLGRLFFSFRFFDQSDEELKRREEEERAQLELRERQMFHQRLRQQRLESEADSKWLQQEEQNIELPFSPVRN